MTDGLARIQEVFEAKTKGPMYVVAPLSDYEFITDKWRVVRDLQDQRDKLAEALKWYAHMRIEVIVDCQGGMSMVPHKLGLYDKARRWS